MSNQANNIYDDILNSNYFSGSISPDIQEYHKSIINVFLNYQSGSATINLWDKLDFFFFFDTDNESLRYINWKDPSQPAAKLGNDNYFPSHNLLYLGPAQDQIAKWWDGKSTPFGDKNSVFGDKTLSYAWENAVPEIQIPITAASGSIGGVLKQFTLNGYIPTEGTGSFPDTYVNTLTQTFDYFPFTSSYSYAYHVNNLKWAIYDSGSYTNFNSLNNGSNFVSFDNINGDTSTYTGSLNIQNTRPNSTISAITVQVLQSPLRHRITITAPSNPPTTGFAVSSIVLGNDTFNSRKKSFFNAGYNTLFDSVLSNSANGLYWMSIFQEWVLGNNYLPGIVKYPNYYQALQLNNGTYFNTNYNIKQLAQNYKLNDGFIGFLKIGDAGGVETKLLDSPFTTTVSTRTGSLFLGVAEDLSSENSLAVKINKQYFTSSLLDTGYQAGLGLAINDAIGTKNYTWQAYTGSNPYPYSSSAPGNIDFPGRSVTASNASARAGRPGLYIAQRSLFQGNALITQYYNNLIAASQSLSPLSGSLPDGKFLLNGLGSPSYCDPDYVLSEPEKFLTGSLGTISSVSTGSFFGTASYSLLGQISSVEEASTKVLTYFTGSYNSTTGIGENGYFRSLPSVLTENNSFSIILRNVQGNDLISLPNINDFIHVGYSDNQIGIVTSVTKTVYPTNEVDFNILGVATKTTGSGINSGNSTIIRFYENDYLNVGLAFNSVYRQTLYNTIISGSGLKTTSSVLNQIFSLSPSNSQVVKYPFGGSNGLPNQTLSFTSGSQLGLIISSSISLYPQVNSGWKLASPSGSSIYSGSEFGTTYFTDFTGSYLTSSNELGTIFITNAAGLTLYDNSYFLTNGSYNLASPSVSGSSFQFRYSSSNQLSQLSGISTSSLFKITSFNSAFTSSLKYVIPDGEDLKTSEMQSDTFMMLFAGGGVNNTNLRFLYKQLYDVIYSRGKYKVTSISIENFNSDSEVPASSVNYPSGIDTIEEKLRWYAATDVQSFFAGSVNNFGNQLFNPFSFTGSLYDTDI